MDSPANRQTEGPEEAIALSALQHVSYCPRQYALIHLEQGFEENALTLRGQSAHQRVDRTTERRERGVRVLRGVRLHSAALGLVGRADVVEQYPDGTLFPVEYKLGKHRAKRHDDIRLAAQALCLEEMTGKAVPRGAIYHVAANRRREVVIDAALREEVRRAAEEIRQIRRAGVLPPPVHDRRCRQCSLIRLCQPELLERANSESDRAWRALFQIESEPTGDG